jgi:hypothetical protein
MQWRAARRLGQARAPRFGPSRIAHRHAVIQVLHAIHSLRTGVRATL